LFDAIIAKSKSAEGHYSEKDAATLIRKILSAIDHCHSEHDIVRKYYWCCLEEEVGGVLVVGLTSYACWEIKVTFGLLEHSQLVSCSLLTIFRVQSLRSTACVIVAPIRPRPEA